MNIPFFGCSGHHYSHGLYTGEAKLETSKYSNLLKLKALKKRHCKHDGCNKTKLEFTTVKTMDKSEAKEFLGVS